MKPRHQSNDDNDEFCRWRAWISKAVLLRIRILNIVFGILGSLDRFFFRNLSLAISMISVFPALSKASYRQRFFHALFRSRKCRHAGRSVRK